MAGKATLFDSRIKYKNVQFWVSDLMKAYDQNLPNKNNEWITSIGKSFKFSFHLVI